LIKMVELFKYILLAESCCCSFLGGFGLIFHLQTAFRVLFSELGFVTVSKPYITVLTHLSPLTCCWIYIIYVWLLAQK
jgi:hypothetical protein